MSRRQHRARRPLRLLQINVRKSHTPHELALATAYAERVDILLIQEPYIHSELQRRITKRHPAFECFSPTDSWTVPPRTLTYVRKGVGLQVEQLRPIEEELEGVSDLVFLSILSPSYSKLIIINVYNAPPGSRAEGKALEALYDCPSSLFTNTFIAGDFNLHHHFWQPTSTQNSTAAESFITWLDSHTLGLTSEIGVPTHAQGNVLDLAFASTSLQTQGITTVCAPELDISSDHLPLTTELCWDHRFQEHPPRLRPDTLEEEKYLPLLQQGLSTWDHTKICCHRTLDTAAAELATIIQNAYQGAASRTLGNGTGVPWWDQQCSQALQTFRKSGRLPENRKALRRTIRRAKRCYLRNKLDTATSMSEVYKMTKWHKSTGSFRSPPLKDPTRPNNPPASSLQEKREILARNLLQNLAEAGDIPLDSPTVPKRALVFPEITTQELRNALLSAGNTAPGDDEITTAILKAGWHLLEQPIFRLFQKCLLLGHHPACFRTAILVILSKNNKPDKTSPRAYRPIALLSVLGKGLERLLARRMSWLAIEAKILAKQQFGALPLRSAVDLTTCLTHDVETALNQGLVASLLILDIKGAFDSVLIGRLVRRLREQGWPDPLVRWVASFASNRKVRIRLDGSLGPLVEIHCGLPQGSPISPILFMLYVSPLLLMGNTSRRFGYADDLGMLHTSPSLEENAEALTNALNDALEWGTSEGITFEASKSELIHFSRRKSDKNNSPKTVTSTSIIKEIANKPLRWLGVLFDRKLTFKWHVQAQAAKALKVSKALVSLGNTVRGVPPKLLQKAVIACVLPVAYFAAETWWPGRTRTKGSTTVSNRVDSHLTLLSKVVRTAARAILPVYRTTPIAVLHRESGLPPPEISLNAITFRAAARLRRLDPRHPLLTRSARVRERRQPTSRFARQVLKMPAAEQTNPLSVIPWKIADRASASQRIGAPNGASKEHCAKVFRDFLRDIPPYDIIVYSDGSKLEEGGTGAGFVAYQFGLQILRQAIPLGNTQEVYDAEARAALAGLEGVLQLDSTRFATNLWICLDNIEVATQLLSHTKGSSQAVFQKFATQASQWPLRARLPHTRPGEVCIRWAPGHMNIPGNEAADKAAKEGAAMQITEELPHSLASLRRMAKAIVRTAMNKLWLTVAPQPYRDLGIQHSPLNPRELTLPRPVLARILAARSGHGDFADYHERFNHIDAHLYCRCGARKAPLHFFFCNIAKRRSRRPPGPPSTTLAELLGTWDGIEKLALWLNRTRFYEDICPRVLETVP